MYMTIPEEEIAGWVEVGYFTKDMLDYIFEVSDHEALLVFVNGISWRHKIRHRDMLPNAPQYYLELYRLIGTPITSFNDIKYRILTKGFRRLSERLYTATITSISEYDNQAHTTLENIAHNLDIGSRSEDDDYLDLWILADIDYALYPLAIDLTNALCDSKEEYEIIKLYTDGYNEKEIKQIRGISEYYTRKLVMEFRHKLSNYVRFGYSIY